MIKSVTGKGSFSLVAISALMITASIARGQPAPIDSNDYVVELLRLQPFAIEAPYVHTWGAELPRVDSGYFLILDVDPAPPATDGLEPVLYVEGVAAERLNFGQRPSRVYALAPIAPRHGDDPLAIWYGSPALPEEITHDDVESEHIAALARGMTYTDAARVEMASKARDGEYFPMLSAEHRVDLLKTIADIVMREDDGGADATYITEFVSAPTYELPPEIKAIVENARR